MATVRSVHRDLVAQQQHPTCHRFATSIQRMIGQIGELPTRGLSHDQLFAVVDGIRDLEKIKANLERVMGDGTRVD